MKGELDGAEREFKIFMTFGNKSNTLFIFIDPNLTIHPCENGELALVKSK